MSKADLGVLFLHGLPLDGRMWEAQRAILPQRTFAPDLYKFGDSLTAWAERCLDEVPTERFVVVGCSVGGSCALEVLRLAPERVAATVLVGTKARHDPDPAFAAKAQYIVERQGVEAAWEQLWEPLFAFANHADARDRCRDIAVDQSPNDLMNGLVAFHTRTSREDVVKTSTSPLHVVSGELDEFPGLAYSRRLTWLNPVARLHVIRSCGHYAPVVKPRETSSIIANVLDQVSA